MNVYPLSESNIPGVARLMTDIKPDWWDYEGAVSQLSDIRNTTYNVGWLMGEDERRPIGWLLFTEHAQQPA
jgi:hypothetical protein